MHAPSSEISVDDEDRGSSPPGSSRRAGGYSPVLRLTADEMRPPLFPCPKKFTFWDTGIREASSRLPLGEERANILLLACRYQEGSNPGLARPLPCQSSTGP